MKVGVLAVQGAVMDHLDALRKAAAQERLAVETLAVRTRGDLDQVDGIVLPGGESTTISRLLRAGGMHLPLVERARAGDLAVYGTCAGMVLTASRARQDLAAKDIHLLGLLDAEVDRNAYGRQRDSFEAQVPVEGVGHVQAVYIRAPVFTEVWGDTKALASDQRGIVAAQKDRILATAFHPELTPDVQMHRHFLRLCSA